jgi:hypothetical protein
MQHPDEGTIHAWLDGQLSETEAATVESHVNGCADCAAAVAEARGFIAASSRIVSALDIVPGGVIPAPRPVQRRWYQSTQLRAAAAVAFLAGASLLVLRDRATVPVDDTELRAVASPKAVAGQQPATVVVPSGADGSQRRIAITEPKRETQQRPQAPAASVTREPKPALLKVDPVVVTGRTAEEDFTGRGLAAGAAVAATDAVADFRFVRTDSSTVGVKVSVYSLADGTEITLTESAMTPLAAPGVSALSTARARELRASKSVANAAAPPPAAIADQRAEAVSQLAIEAVSWTDSVTRRSFTLRGRTTREKLLELKAKLENQVKPRQ